MKAYALLAGLLCAPAWADVYVEGGYGKGAEMSDDSGYAASTFAVGYAWERLEFQLGYDHGEAKLLGQTGGTFDSATAEVSYTQRFNKRFSMNVGLGVWYPVSMSLPKHIEEEVVYTYLVNKHSAGGTKPVPLDPISNGDYVGCYTLNMRGYEDANCYSTLYEVDPSPYVSLGFRYAPNTHLSVGVEYRYLRPYRFTAIARDASWIGDPSADIEGRGYWEERANVNYDSVFVTFRYTF